jgi:AcrR family transcriptional regulator
MSPRTRTASDDDIIDAAIRAIGHTGPARLTLAAVAAEVGLSPATLLQRFGSKRGLLLAVARRASRDNAAAFDAARAANPSPLGALIDVVLASTRWFESPETLANHLAFLQMDLTDPEFLELAATASTAFRDGIRALLDDAVQAEEVAPCDTTRLAGAIDATHGGSTLAWAIHRTGSLADWVRRDVETLLTPYMRR